AALSVIALLPYLLHYLRHQVFDFLWILILIALLDAVHGGKEIVLHLLLVTLPLIGADEDSHGPATALENYGFPAVVHLPEDVAQVGAGVAHAETLGHDATLPAMSRIH